MTLYDKKEWACQMLRQKTNELGAMPKKQDFDETVRSRIKAYLGPWPRALEAAGLKESRQKSASRKKSSVSNLPKGDNK